MTGENKDEGPRASEEHEEVSKGGIRKEMKQGKDGVQDGG